MGYRTRGKANGEGMDTNTAQTGLDDKLKHFFKQYPVDIRAVDYLTSSLPGVVDRVTSEFVPRNRGEADYSALVMAFTKRCREQERAAAGTALPSMGNYDNQGGHCAFSHHGSHSDYKDTVPPWKRARTY